MHAKAPFVTQHPGSPPAHRQGEKTPGILRLRDTLSMGSRGRRGEETVALYTENKILQPARSLQKWPEMACGPVP